eukprot:Skav222004  [mRNA]  locus=scaffold2020:120279:120882:- [translate_table: standard]
MSIAVVTGANRVNGIGYEIARGLAHRLPEGSSVVLTARAPEMGKAMESLKSEVGDRVKAREGLKMAEAYWLLLGAMSMDTTLVLHHQLDISDEKSVESLRDFISKELGGIDLLVNNAGMAFPMSDPTPFKEQARQTIEAWQDSRLVNDAWV